MTTKELERGRLKCHKYWPDLEEEEQVYGVNGEFRVKNTKEATRGEYIVRVLELRRISKGRRQDLKAGKYNILEPNGKDAAARHIYHYQFLGWEDQTSPSGQLLNYMDEINTCYETKCPSNSGPIVVHCS